LLALVAHAIAAADYATSTAAPVIPPIQPGPPYLEIGPMLGHVSPNDARIWIKGTGAARMSARVATQPDLADARTIEGPQLVAEAGFAAHVVIPGLQPSTRYFYSILLDGQPVMTRPWPAFTTPPADGTPGKTRIAFGSCVGKEGWLDAAAWADLEARTRVDLVLMLGDNHYANTTDPIKQRASFVAHRRNPGFVELTRRTPVYAIWDDHDFGVNDSDGTSQGKERALQTFKEFFANPAYGETDNPAVYFKFTRGDLDFFMLDGRYYRSPNKMKDDGTKTMLGRKQVEWLKRELLASRGKIKFIASGGEWQAHSQPDSWVSFLRERNEIFDFLAMHDIRNVVLLSGDRHFTSVYSVEGRFIEVSSGPLGSPNAKLPKTWPAEMLSGYDHGKIFCIWDVDTTGAAPRLTLEIYEAGAGLLEKRLFSWDEVTGAAKIERRQPAPVAKPAAPPKPAAPDAAPATRPGPSQ
jgi:alkaline phosphatase D